ncbi:hypothetical protein BC827DRAFT_1156911 [Russula dissimulans]|nr:hypothetical protein BC827DRAFT_1156911 [Russula dissimulans]
MLFSMIIPLYALALVHWQATAMQVDVSPRDIDMGCVLVPNGNTIWSLNEGLAKSVRWKTSTPCVNSTMPDLGTIRLFLANSDSPTLDDLNPDYVWPGKTLARNVNLRSGQTTVDLTKDTPTANFILSCTKDGMVSNGSHLSQVFLIAEE